MKKSVKILTAIAALLLCSAEFIFAKDAVFNGENYNINLSYNDTASPGDAVFIRMSFTDISKKTKKSADSISSSAELYLDDKKISSSEFYNLPDSSSHSKLVYLTGIPLSSWWTEGNYHLTVIYSFDGGKNMQFDLPFSLTHKDFVSETIELDEKNTGIKTDTSPERMKQIERLNSILEKIDDNAIYQTGKFTLPTTSTRRTSFFADRRVYAYTNGKSSTSLHYGIDYGIPTGTSVTSCGNGKVVLAENRVSTGWSVVVEHLPGLYSLYYHMSELNVKAGDMVKTGDRLGLSGATGLATGPHLHWEVRLNMCAVSPDFFTTDFTFANTSK